MSQPIPGKPGNPKNPIGPKKPLTPGIPHGDPRLKEKILIPLPQKNKYVRSKQGVPKDPTVYPTYKTY